jgi:hypothetical protein
LPIHRQDALPQPAATTARYAHLASDPVKAAPAAVAAKIAAAMSAGASDTANKPTVSPSANSAQEDHYDRLL